MTRMMDCPETSVTRLGSFILKECTDRLFLNVGEYQSTPWNIAEMRSQLQTTLTRHKEILCKATRRDTEENLSRIRYFGLWRRVFWYTCTHLPNYKVSHPSNIHIQRKGVIKISQNCVKSVHFKVCLKDEKQACLKSYLTTFYQVPALKFKVFFSQCYKCSDF
jgi:hypothetical protein